MRTITEHTWAEIEHHLNYKPDDSEVEIDLNYKRRLNALMALFEIANREFDAIRKKYEESITLSKNKALEIILKKQNRKIIYELILQKPGIYFTKIVKGLSLNKHIAMWHLDRLVESNYIKSGLFLSHQIYFKSDLELDDAKPYFFLYKDKSRKIIEYLMEKEVGITDSQISHDTKIQYNSVRKYIAYLEEYQYIKVLNGSNMKLYSINKTNNFLGNLSKQ